MPVPTLDQVQKKEASIKTKIADSGESLEKAARRTLGKQLRRVQRKRRHMVAEAKRRAPKPKEKAEESKPAEVKAAATEAPAKTEEATPAAAPAKVEAEAPAEAPAKAEAAAPAKAPADEAKPEAEAKKDE